MKLPKILNRSNILYVDMTPNDMLPIRILEAYLDKSREKWEVHGLSKKESAIYEMMNEYQDQRAKILENAIKRLQK